MIGALRGGKIEKLEHRVTDHPLVADQRLDHIGIGVPRARDQFSGAVLFIEVLANFAHALVVPFDRAIVFVEQLHAVKSAVLEREPGPLQSRMDQPFHGPDVASLFFLAQNDFCLGAFENAFNSLHGIVPAKAEGRKQLLGGLHVSCQQRKGERYGKETAHDQRPPRPNRDSFSQSDSFAYRRFIFGLDRRQFAIPKGTKCASGGWRSRLEEAWYGAARSEPEWRWRRRIMEPSVP